MASINTFRSFPLRCPQDDLSSSAQPMQGGQPAQQSGKAHTGQQFAKRQYPPSSDQVKAVVKRRNVAEHANSAMEALNLLKARGSGGFSKTGEPPSEPLSVVQDVLVTVRKEILEKNLGSSNLYNPMIEGDKERAEQAAREMARLQESNDPVAAALKGRAHNCGPLSDIAREMLSILGFNALKYEEFASVNHAVVVCSTGKLNVEALPLDMQKWPPNVYVCDVWADISCAAPEYNDLFKMKMNMLSDSGTKIYFEGDDGQGEIDPRDQRWINGITSPREDWSAYD